MTSCVGTSELAADTPTTVVYTPQKARESPVPLFRFHDVSWGGWCENLIGYYLILEFSWIACDWLFLTKHGCMTDCVKLTRWQRPDLASLFVSNGVVVASRVESAHR